MSDNLPVKLYKFLSEEVGSEDVVLTRRLLYSIVDYVCSTKHFIRMTSGSKGEGLDMKGSDLDIMVLFNNINIYEFPQERYPPDSFIMSTKSTKPGFTHLQVCGKINPLLRCLCVNFENQLCLSSDLLKSCIQIAHNISTPPSPIMVHGPCLSPNDYSKDLAITFRCKSWVGLAHQWITRNRSWPTSELISKITDFGVLFVPIGCKGSPNEFVEWRVSFSAAEKLLIHSFPHTQLLCYALLKLLLKDIIEQNEICKGLLCSYFLKTVVFWESESLPASEWRPENIVSCFMKVFKRLLYFVEYNHLPHYFITDNDLFENRFSLEQHTALKTELSRLYQKGIFCMSESHMLSSFFYPVEESLNDFMTRDEEIILEKLNILLRFHLFHLDDCITIIMTPKNALEKLLDLQNHNKLKSNSFPYLTICYGVLQILGSKHIIRQPANKVHYKDGYKHYFPYLMCGRKTDAVSGWLSVASYFYKMKRYQTVMHIVDHVLLKCTRDKIFHRTGKHISCELSDINENNLCQTHSNAGDIFRRKVVRYPRSFFLYSIDIPELCFFSDLPPKVYAIFLKFLCFYHFSDVRRLRVALADLQSAVQNIHSDSDLWLSSTSNICLGVSYYMSGERDNARLCFKRAFESNHHDLPYFLNIYYRLVCLKK